MVIEILSEEMELPFEDLVFGKCGLGHGEVEFRRANPDGEPAEEGGSMAFLAGGMVPDQATNLFSLVMSHGKILEETQVVVLQADCRRELRMVVCQNWMRASQMSTSSPPWKALSYFPSGPHCFR